MGNGPYGSNAVRGVVTAIVAGRGAKIERSQAVPGDIWTDGSASGLHIGIVWEADANGAKTILSNSSSKARFSWIASVEFMDQYYGVTSNFYRVTN